MGGQMKSRSHCAAFVRNMTGLKEVKGINYFHPTWQYGEYAYSSE
jgi:hypothetical protein